MCVQGHRPRNGGGGGGGVKGKRDGEEGEEGEEGWERGTEKRGERMGRGLGSERGKLKMKGHSNQPYSYTIEMTLSVVQGHHRPLCMLLEICNRIRFCSATCLV